MALELLKPHLTRRLAGRVSDVKLVETAATQEDPFTEEPLKAESTTDEVLVIQLGGELASQELIAELKHAAAKIAENASYRAIVLASTGGDFLGAVEAALVEQVVGQF